MGQILDQAVWGTFGHSWFYEIPLNASYIPLRPTVSPFNAAQGIHSCHSLPEDEHNSNLDATPWAHRAESDSKNKPLIKMVKWSPLMPTMTQFPFPKSISKIGASYQRQAAAEATEWQNGPLGMLCRCQSEWHGKSFSSLGLCEFSAEVCSNQVINMTYIEITCSCYGRSWKWIYWAVFKI